MFLMRPRHFQPFTIVLLVYMPIVIYDYIFV